MADFTQMDPFSQFSNWLGSTSNWAAGASNESIQDTLIAKEKKAAADAAKRQAQVDAIAKKQAALESAERERQTKALQGQLSSIQKGIQQARITSHHQAALADRERRVKERQRKEQYLQNAAEYYGQGNLAGLNWDRSAPVSAKDLVTIRTSAGNVTVNKQAAQDFQNFINETERRGYNISSLGGYNPRKTRNGNLWSMHSGGYAIDINPATNPHTGKLITDMPTWMVNLGAKYNLYWGGAWKSSKDPMHWSWGYSG